MTFIQSPAKVLVTGANGYFAAHAIKNLLERGFTVLGTVRSESKGEELSKLFTSHSGQFGYEVVPDITTPGAFDKVIKEGNFDAVAHTASPVVIPGGTVGDFIKPAIDGTVGILDSIKSHGQNVKRVVITSSVAAMHSSQKGLKHNETHWNDYIAKLAQEQGDKLPPGMAYIYSKALAEKAVWRWWSENKVYVNWDLATINPCFMMGEPIHAISSRDQLTSTNAVLSSIPSPHQDFAERPWAIIHVRDVAAVHSALFENVENVSGRRVIVVGSEPSWQDMYDALASFPGVPRGSPGVGTNPDTGSPSWDATYARELLGREFIGTKDMLVETEGYYRKKGWSFFV